MTPQSHSTPNSFLAPTISTTTTNHLNHKALLTPYTQSNTYPFAACTDISHMGPLPHILHPGPIEPFSPPSNTPRRSHEHSLFTQPQPGPPSENPGPWAERSRALIYRAVTDPKYNWQCWLWALPGPTGPLKVAGPLGICPPAPPLGGPDHNPTLAASSPPQQHPGWMTRPLPNHLACHSDPQCVQFT